MNKALSVKKNYILPHYKKNGLTVYNDVHLLNNFSTVLLNRPECETNEEYLQIIPYITLVDKHKKHVFTYMRGKGSKETRIHDLFSIGLGGHIEIEPDHSSDLLDTIAASAAIELEEEVGLKGYKESILKKLRENDFGIFYDDSTDFNRVHLAISIVLHIDSDHLNTIIGTESKEPDVVKKCQWLHLYTIDEKISAKEITLESWSSFLFNMIKDWSIDNVGYKFAA